MRAPRSWLLRGLNPARQDALLAEKFAAILVFEGRKYHGFLSERGEERIRSYVDATCSTIRRVLHFARENGSA